MVKRRASHRAAVHGRPEPVETGKSEREIRDKKEMQQQIRQKEDLQLHPEKQRELGEEQKRKYDDIEKEITEVLKRHDVPMQSEFLVQMRS